MVVSQLHSTRHLQTMSLCLFAKLILPDLELRAAKSEWNVAEMVKNYLKSPEKIWFNRLGSF